MRESNQTRIERSIRFNIYICRMITTNIRVRCSFGVHSLSVYPVLHIVLDDKRSPEEKNPMTTTILLSSRDTVFSSYPSVYLYSERDFSYSRLRLWFRQNREILVRKTSRGMENLCTWRRCAVYTKPPEEILRSVSLPVKFLTGPGPSNCSDRVLRSLGQQVLGHLHPEICQVFPGLCEISRPSNYRVASSIYNVLRTRADLSNITRDSRRGAKR